MRAFKSAVVFIAVSLTSLASAEEYFLCFPANFRDPNAESLQNDEARYKLRNVISIGSVVRTNIRVSAPSIGLDTVFIIEANANTSVDLTGKATLLHQTGTTSHSILITASSPVQVTAHSTRFQSSEAFAVYPSSVLGSEYVVSSYSRLAEGLTGSISIIGTKDGTRVKLLGPQGSADWDESLANGIEITLNRGQVYTYAAISKTGFKCDPTGTAVKSSSPVAVISGHSCAYVPAKIEACNPLYEQLLPIPTLGKSIFVPPLAGRAESVVRVISGGTAATVRIDNNEPVSLQPRSFLEFDRKTESMHIQSDSPVEVALFGKGYKSGDNVGDPCMIMMAPASEFARTQMISAVLDKEWMHYLTVTCPPGHTSEVLVDNIAIAESEFVSSSKNGFRYAIVRVEPGAHTVSSQSPVGVFINGIGTGTNVYDAYGIGGSMVISR